MAIRIIQNVPPGRVETLVEVLLDAGAIEVQRIEEMDGEFTLVVTYPDREKLADLDDRRAARPPAPDG